MTARKILQHGIPQHDYFGILQPCFQAGGLDCSCVAMGLGEIHQLQNPYTGETLAAVLINRRTLYTESDLFEGLSYILYGMDPRELLPRFQSKHPDMIPEIMELWTFRKVRN